MARFMVFAALALSGCMSQSAGEYDEARDEFMVAFDECGAYAREHYPERD